MPRTSLWRWWQTERRPLAFGLAAGLLWGSLVAATVTPRDWLVYDLLRGLVYGYSDEGLLLRTQPADVFFREYTAVLVQATLLLLLLAGLAGWATWQLTRVRPRGEEQPPLLSGTDWYVIALALGGLFAVLAFRRIGAATWLKDDRSTFLASATALVEVALPLYMGASLFLTWFRRLPSIKAPDWETRYPRPARRPAGAHWWPWRRNKGGEPPAAS